MSIFKELDRLRAKIDRDRVEPLFSEAIERRQNRYLNNITLEENNLLRVMAKLIAYSNNAPSDQVTRLLKTDAFESAFHNFDLAAVASEDEERIIREHWEAIRSIRFKKKVGYIIKCARLLQNDGGDATIRSLYEMHNIPIQLTSTRDIDVFWEKFDLIIDGYKNKKMPYFKNTTSLLHLLLHIGFPCIKPDLIIMRTAASLGIVQERQDHNQYRPHERRFVVKTLQEYCLSRGIHPAVLDLYLLVCGGQRDTAKYLINHTGCC